MKFNVKSVVLTTFLAGTVSAGLAQRANANEKLSVAATPVPAAEILEFIKPILAKEGVDLDIKVFTDYIQPNQTVADKEIDMNCYQHLPHLQAFNQQRGTDLVSVGYIYVPPLAAYSEKIKSVAELKDGAIVAIPNDTTNSTRALLLLQKVGLIKLKNPNDLFATASNIVENPKDLSFKELEAASLPRVLPDVDIAVINTNYALEVGLSPQKDSIFREDADSAYANLCAARPDNKDRPAIKNLMQAWHSPEVVKFIEEKYKGTVIPRAN